MVRSHRLQSAMEYLMTYGWAILVIAVVLGALYQLGIFNGVGGSLQSSCFAHTGYFCSTPILNTSGYLSVTLGQIGQTITITNVGCTKNITSPTTTQNVLVTIPSGSRAALQFSCQTSANAIGTAFSGYLWITYNTPTQSGIVDRVAEVTAKIQTTANVTKAQQASGQGGTTTTSTSTSTSTSTTSVSTTTIIYTYNSGEQSSHGMTISVGSGNSWICVSSPYYDSQTPFPPSGFNYAFDISAAGSPSIGRPASDLCTYSNAGGDEAEGEFALTSPPAPTITTINAIAATSQLLNYNVASSNSFVLLVVGCGSGGHNAGCMITIPGGCVQAFNANDGAMNAYGAVCANQAAGSYTVNAFYTGTGEYAMAAYVYH